MLKSPLILLSALFLSIIVMPVFADTIAGTLISVSSDGTHLVIKDGVQSKSVEVGKNTKIMRGQVSKVQQEVTSKELAPGDRILASVSVSGPAESIRASYSIVVGIVEKTVGRKIILKQGNAVFLRNEAQIVLASGKTGLVADIKPGAFVICRLEPVSKECWTAVVSGTKDNTVKPVQKTVKSLPTAQQKTKPITKPAVSNTNIAPGPRISSVKIDSASELRSGDVISVIVNGTPGGIAKAEIRGISGPVQLKETKSGI